MPIARSRFITLMRDLSARRPPLSWRSELEFAKKAQTFAVLDTRECLLLLRAERLGEKGQELTQLPDGVEHGAVDPLHHGHGTIAQLRQRGLAAADALD